MEPALPPLKLPNIDPSPPPAGAFVFPPSSLPPLTSSLPFLPLCLVLYLTAENMEAHILGNRTWEGEREGGREGRRKRGKEGEGKGSGREGEGEGGSVCERERDRERENEREREREREREKNCKRARGCERGCVRKVHYLVSLPRIPRQLLRQLLIDLP
jgi:hypothetical protein